LARDESINNAVWDEADFYALSAPAKLVFIWSWTNRRCDFSGIYQVPLEAIVSETKHTEDDVRSALAELEASEKVFYDGTWLFVRNRVKRLKTRTKSMCIRVARDLQSVPESHPYRRLLLDLQGVCVWQSANDRTTIRGELDTLSGATPDPQGSYPENGSNAPINGSDPDRTRVAHMTETKTETKPIPRGRGVGRGQEPYEPNPDIVVLQSEHFPNVEVSALEDASRRLRRAGVKPTPTTLRDHLASVYRELGIDVEGVTC
jgi:hypothetical protein